MGMSRAQKEAEVQVLNDRFERDETIVVTHYSGLSVPEMEDLRAKLRAEGASFKVTKNSLAVRALKGTKFEGIEDLFTGPTGVASFRRCCGGSQSGAVLCERERQAGHPWWCDGREAA